MFNVQHKEIKDFASISSYRDEVRDSIIILVICLPSPSISDILKEIGDAPGSPKEYIRKSNKVTLAPTTISTTTMLGASSLHTYGGTACQIGPQCQIFDIKHLLVPAIFDFTGNTRHKMFHK